MATLIFAPLENSIKAQFHDTGLFSTGSLLVYCIIIFFLAVTTYGASAWGHVRSSSPVSDAVLLLWQASLFPPASLSPAFWWAAATAASSAS